ncbi:MAG: hypothetical protein HY298_08935 [Verrucomicrobia bacterium]|nr:hypothetical protein [Verrucomicrobiota bacterium]
MKKLNHVLRTVGKPTKVYTTSDGARLLVLPYGGRALGLFPAKSDENFYWTHPALESVKSARDFYASDQWHNSGGDRTWLASEVDLFFPNFPKLDPYFQQRSLDPGRYQAVATKNGFQLVNRLTVNLSRSKKDLRLKITKSFGPAANPLRHERGLKLQGIAYAGYTQSTSLELVGASRRTRDQVGLWNLIQMPHGGDLLIPTFSRSKPRQLFSTVGTIPPQDLITTDHLIRYRMRQKGEHKIGIRAVSVCNRIGYLHRAGDQWALIIRNFVVNPSGEYVDVPWTETDDFGFAVQACNINSQLGAFSELEYHSPAIGHGTGCTRRDDEAQVWAFRGRKAEIELIAKTLLTPTPWVEEEE